MYFGYGRLGFGWKNAFFQLFVPQDGRLHRLFRHRDHRSPAHSAVGLLQERDYEIQ